MLRSKLLCNRLISACLVSSTLVLSHCSSGQIRTIPDASKSLNQAFKSETSEEWQRIEAALKDENPPPESSVKLFLIQKLASSDNPKAKALLWKYTGAANETFRQGAWNSLQEKPEADFEKKALQAMAANMQRFGLLLDEELAILTNYQGSSAVQLKGLVLRRMPDKSSTIFPSLIADIKAEKDNPKQTDESKSFNGLSLAENELWNFIRENPDAEIVPAALDSINAAWDPAGIQHIYNVSRQGGFSETALEKINAYLQEKMTPQDKQSLAEAVSAKISLTKKSDKLALNKLQKELTFLGYSKPILWKKKNLETIETKYAKAGRAQKKPEQEQKTQNVVISSAKLKSKNGIDALDSFWSQQAGIKLAGSRMHETLMRLTSKPGFEQSPESRILYSAINQWQSGLNFFEMNKLLKKGYYNKGFFSALMRVIDKSQRSTEWKRMVLKKVTGLKSQEVKKLLATWQRNQSKLKKINL